jgi:tRNA uridine 5-carbamoylmethylation protein Kti12
MNSIFEDVFKKHIKKLKNIDIENDSLIIAFAGVPGSGKTSIAIELEKRLKGMRISSMDVQLLLEGLRKEKLYEGHILEKREYIYCLLEKIFREYRNKLIILDKGIDRTYEEVKDFCYKNYVKLLVIALDVGKDVVRERLILREGKLAIDYLNNLDRWFEDYQDFKNKGNYDFLFDTEIYTSEEIAERIIENI